jgi:putative transposase
MTLPRCQENGIPQKMTLPKCQEKWYIEYMRKDPLVNGHFYHIISRSIAKFEVFKSQKDCFRLMRIVDLFQYKEFIYKYSNFLSLKRDHQKEIIQLVKNNSPKLIDIIAYCVMPTHIHLILKQNIDQGLSKYLARVLNGYSRYFNLRHHRKGPLWEDHFKSILIRTDEQLLHLTRYLHLNPVSVGLVKNPQDWQFSSYKEYIGEVFDGICNWQGVLEIDKKKYQKFVNSRISRQKELAKIKHLINEDYAG